MIVYYDKTKMWRYRIGPFMAGALVCLYGVVTNDSGIRIAAIYLAGAVIMGAFALWYRRLTDSPEPRIEISAAGLQDSQLGVGLIQWPHVRSLTPVRKHYLFAAMDHEVRDEYLAPLNPYRRRVRELNGVLTGGVGLLIDTHHLTESQEDILAALIDHHRHG